MVNLEWYRTFKAIYQNGTLTKAAQELMISQPNASIQLASLENYIGKQLFIRLPRKMLPTEYGKKLYAQIIEPIDNLERVEMEFKRKVLDKTPHIRLGTPSEVFNNYLVENIDQLRLDMTVVYGLADDLTDKLTGNCIDIAILTKRLKNDEHIIYERLATENLMVLCNTGMNANDFEAWVASGDLSKIEKWLKEQKWYAYDNDLSVIKRFWRENFKKRPYVKLQAVIPDYNSILKAVAQNNALTIASDLIANKALADGQVKILWKGTKPTTNDLYLAYNKNKLMPDLLSQISQFIKRSIVPK